MFDDYHCFDCTVTVLDFGGMEYPSVQHRHLALNLQTADIVPTIEQPSVPYGSVLHKRLRQSGASQAALYLTASNKQWYYRAQQSHSTGNAAVVYCCG